MTDWSVLAVFGSVFSLMLGRMVVRRLPRWRVLLALRGRAEPIVDAIDGQVAKLVGTVEAGAPLLESPVTGQPCVAFEIIVTYGPMTMRREHSAVDFSLRDDSGVARIPVAGATMALWSDRSWDLPMDEPPPRLAAYLGNRLPRSSPYFQQIKMTVIERVLRVRDRAAVMGLVRHEPDPEAAAYRDTPPSRVVVQAAGRVPLLISNVRVATRR
jgi:hypothetical protein